MYRPQSISFLLLAALLFTGCKTLDQDMILLDVPFFRQNTENDCGVAALKSVFTYHGVSFDETPLNNTLHLPALRGTIPALILEEAQKRLPKSKILHPSFNELYSFLKNGHPPILLLSTEKEQNRGHFVVLTGIIRNGKVVRLHTGNSENTWISRDSFIKKWKAANCTAILMH